MLAMRRTHTPDLREAGRDCRRDLARDMSALVSFVYFDDYLLDNTMRASELVQPTLCILQRAGDKCAAFAGLHRLRAGYRAIQVTDLIFEQRENALDAGHRLGGNRADYPDALFFEAYGFGDCCKPGG